MQRYLIIVLLVGCVTAAIYPQTKRDYDYQAKLPPDSFYHNFTRLLECQAAWARKTDDQRLLAILYPELAISMDKSEEILIAIEFEIDRIQERTNRYIERHYKEFISGYET
jgi:hypothetical protein